MKCKNCQDMLRTDFKYCPSCGAKVVERRLTFKGLTHDVIERVFNLENNVFRTIGQMTVRPERVIMSYVDGTRRKYLNPLNYLTLSIALSGVLFYFMRRFAFEEIDFDVFGVGVNQESNAKLMEATLEFSNFIIILYIPVIALVGFLSFNKRDYNIPEYIVTAIYALSHYSVLSFLPSLIILLNFPQSYLTFSLVLMGFMIVYILFVLIRTHRYSIGMIIIRSIIFIILFLFGYIGASMVVPALLLLTGEMSLQDFAPPPPS